MLVLTAIALGTRAMHLDGFADTVDGIRVGWDRETRLAVMKQGDIGPMGGSSPPRPPQQAVPWSSSWAVPHGYLLGAVTVPVSRGACSLTCLHGIRSARSTGLGLAQGFVVGSGQALEVKAR